MSIVFLIFFSALTCKVNAQKEISLQSAIDTALKNNLSVKNEKLNSEYQKKLNSAAVDIPQTSIIGEYGQYNSIYNDNKIGIAQSINFPAVYAKQKSLQNELYKNSMLNVAFKEAEVKKQVSSIFYLLIYLNEKKKILLHTDSLYAAFLEKNKLSFEKGESTVLEKTTAETLRGQIAIQLNQLQNDIDILQLQFQLLLNSTTKFIPIAESEKLDFAPSLDISAISQHPQMRILEQQQRISKTNTSLQKSKLLPEMNIAFSSTTIRGYGADDIFYTINKRFNSVQLGIGIPLFFGAQQAKINSGKIQQMISDNNYDLGLQALKTEYETALKNYETQKKTINYFENTALKNAEIITQTANQQFATGEINYLEWTMLINNATLIQSNYADAVKDLNQTIIQLNYLITK